MSESDFFSVVLQESIADKLQRDIEIATQELEQEHREEAFLDEQLAQLEGELKEAKERSKLDMSSLKSKIRRLEHRLDLESNGYNEELDRSTILRKEIDVYRLEKNHYKITISKLTNEIKSVSERAREQRSLSVHSQLSDESHRRKILSLNERKGTDRHEYTSRMKHLNSVLKEERQRRINHFKLFEQGFSQRFKNESEGIMIGGALRRLKNIWVSKVIGKKKELDAFAKYISKIRAAFKVIADAFGLEHLEDIVTAVVKAEEQRHKVATYIENLSHDMIEVETSTAEIQAVLDEYQQSRGRGDALVSAKHHDLTGKHSDIREKNKEDQDHTQVIYEKLDGVTDWIHKFQALLQNVPSQGKNSDFILNEHIFEAQEEKIVEAMSDIERITAHLVVSHAYHNQEQRPLLKAIPLHTLEIKDFKQNRVKGLTVDDAMLDDADIEELRGPISVDEFRDRAKTIMKHDSNNSNSLSVAFYGRTITPYL